MAIVLNGTTGITNDGGYTGDGVVFANTTPANTLVTTTGGNVGVGTSSPDARLHVQNSQGGATGRVLIDANVSSGYDARITATDVGLEFSAQSNSRGFVFSTGVTPTERARIDSSGNFIQGAGCRIYSIGTYNLTTAAAANLNVDGNGTFFRSTSALKYKKDIRDLENIDVNLFRAVRYKSKSESDDQTKDHFGIVADEVHAAGVTELVNYGVDGEVEGFQYERLTVVLLKHCQEQQAIITALTARVEALEGK